MSRGDRREKTYLDDVDRHDFLKTLAEACQKTGWQESPPANRNLRCKAMNTKLWVDPFSRFNTYVVTCYFTSNMKTISSWAIAVRRKP